MAALLILTTSIHPPCKIAILLRGCPQHSINRGATDLEVFGDIRGPHALRLQLAQLRGVNRCRPPLIDAGSPGLGDAFELALAAKVCFELGKHAEHIQKALAAVPVSIGCSVAFEAGAAGLHSAHDVLKVTDATSKPVNTGDHENVAATKEIEDGPQFL